MPVTARAIPGSVRELAGAVADLGVLVPIAAALIVVNGLSATAVLLPAGLLYVAAGAIYRLPVPVQPLKAFGAIAIAAHADPEVIAAGAILMGLIFVPLGLSGLLDAAARVVPRPLVRGIQLSVGLIFLKLASDLLLRPPAGSPDAGLGLPLVVGLALGALALAWFGRRWGSGLVLIVLGLAVAAWRWQGTLVAGPSVLSLGVPSAGAFASAAVLLVLPQLPLTFANSCLATADVAHTYFGERAERVTAGRLAVTLGVANIGAGLISGMPVCHGAGGLTAHRSFGARHGWGVATLGAVLVVLALGLGSSLAPALTGFPVWILAALLAVAGLLHIALLRDLRGRWEWSFAVAVGVIGAVANLAVALVGGWLAWWAVSRWRAPASPTP